MADSDPPPDPAAGKVLTRTGVRTIAESLDISLPFARIDKYVEVGVLPDPRESPWIESEVVPRLLRFRDLQADGTSLSRRVVHLHVDQFPVDPAKLQLAMADMLPTIAGAVRKMQAIQRADRWFADLPGNRQTVLKSAPGLPSDWRLPPKSEWAGVLLSEELDRFWSRVGTKGYYCYLLEAIGKDSEHALTHIPKVERLTLMMVADLAANQAIRKQVLEEEAARDRERANGS